MLWKRWRFGLLNSRFQVLSPMIRPLGKCHLCQVRDHRRHLWSNST